MMPLGVDSSRGLAERGAVGGGVGAWVSGVCGGGVWVCVCGGGVWGGGGLCYVRVK